MNNNSLLKDSLFFAEEITFDVSGKKVSQNEIDEIDDFPGKEDFVRFYTTHNGGIFLHGARFFPEECYTTSIKGYPYITMDCFLSIPVDNTNKEMNIEMWKDALERMNENYEDFILFHIPFAIDAEENTFWIDIQSGEIKYTDDQTCINPNKDAVIVASSFKDFCKRIRNEKVR